MDREKKRSDVCSSGCIEDVCELGFVEDIARLTRENTAYRKVVYTAPQMQLVLMSITPTDEGIEAEVHEHSTQFFRVETGRGKAHVDWTVHIPLLAGVSLIVPAGTRHEILNTSDTEPLKLYTIYCPPVHPRRFVQQRRARK